MASKKATDALSTEKLVKLKKSILGTYIPFVTDCVDKMKATDKELVFQRLLECLVKDNIILSLSQILLLKKEIIGLNTKILQQSVVDNKIQKEIEQELTFAPQLVEPSYPIYRKNSKTANFHKPPTILPIRKKTSALLIPEVTGNHSVASSPCSTNNVVSDLISTIEPETIDTSKSSQKPDVAENHSVLDEASVAISSCSTNNVVSNLISTIEPETIDTSKSSEKPKVREKTKLQVSAARKSLKKSNKKRGRKPKVRKISKKSEISVSANKKSSKKPSTTKLSSLFAPKPIIKDDDNTSSQVTPKKTILTRSAYKLLTKKRRLESQ